VFDMRVRFLAVAGAVLVVVAALPGDGRGQRAPAAAVGRRGLEVAVLEAPGVGADALTSAIAAIEAAHLRARVVTPEAVRAGGLEGASVALFTGGRGSVQGRMLGEEGRERVRAFVRGGGGYVGICAGAYMALQGSEEFHKIAIVAGRHATGDAWMRGIAPLRVRPTDGSAAIALHYANGPLIAAEEVRGLPGFVTLATFEEEIHLEREGTHAGEMRGMPAMIASTFGRGRIVLFSPNPTLDPARPELFVGALRFAARGGALPERVGWRDVLGAE
jgi:hypothetical protein